ncbi:MAG: exo-alpha-sialidase [Kiritimatiellae bacterium]|nr:exo-alpha-sialidase [Kiritimatiellia bacterium]
MTAHSSPLATNEFIFQSAPFRSCHASTIAEAADGTLVAAWFGGTHEGHPDVRIWVSRHTGDGWTVPVAVADGRQPDGSRHPCWNPVLHPTREGTLLLLYKVGPDCARWWGMRRVSHDGGRTWSEAVRLPDGVIGPVKNKPVRLPDSSLLAGSSTEHDGWRVHFEHSADDGFTWRADPPVNDGRQIAAIQPAILLLGGGRLVALGRTQQRRIFRLESDDLGRTWRPMTLTDLPNPNSGIDALTLADGRHLLVYNPVERGRSPLVVAISTNAHQWSPLLTLDDEPGAEFSYPAVIQTRDGRVHITYTWKRQRIRHAVLDLSAVPPSATPVRNLTIAGWGWEQGTFSNGAKAFSNREYVWTNVPAVFEGWSCTRTVGGAPCETRVTARTAGRLHAIAPADSPMPDWRPLEAATVHYTDRGCTAMRVWIRDVARDECLVLPRAGWTGVQLLWPPDAHAELLQLPRPPTRSLQPLRYNHPRLVVDLGVGLWAWPLPMDFDGDGDLDLPVNCPDKPFNGVWLFENACADTAANPLPVFRPPRRISRGLQNVQVSYVEGHPRVLTPAAEHPDFLRSGLERSVPLLVPANIHPNRVRANMWRYADYDGDGSLDLVVGVDDWTDYGWDNAYDPAGRWTNGPLRGFVYVLRNAGTSRTPRYERPAKLIAGDRPVEVFGWPSPNLGDFDGDGDLDLICGEFLDRFTWFRNIGRRTEPRYEPGRRLVADDGRPLAMDLQMITPVALDWDRDGDLDLIAGDEDGRVALIEHTGRIAPDGVPIFRAPRYFQQEADLLKFGALATPCGADWDGDGDIDLLCGNTAGYIGFIENLSGPGVEYPRWAPPRRLEADGRVIRIQAGPNGSIQGPAEAKWGYTTLTVADWDHDGLPDLVVNSIWGLVHWYRNVGSRTAPKLAAPAPIEVEWQGPPPALAWGWLRPKGRELLTQWRTTPVAVDWNRDGLTDLLMLDAEGYLAFFERARDRERLILRHPRRALCDESGRPLRLNARVGGRSGRRKLCVTDWDGDGRLDLLLNAENARWLRQISEREGRWLFRDMGLLSDQNIEGHDVSPTTVDFNGDGIPDLLAGAEDGHFYYLRNPRSEP